MTMLEASSDPIVEPSSAQAKLFELSRRSVELSERVRQIRNETRRIRDEYQMEQQYA
ncbi:MAG: hypothetical protein AB8B85_07780 [Paracoccaceae bacterium]